MADSPTHQLGEFIGWVVEEAAIRYVAPIAKEYGFYLDYKHERPARDGKHTVTWQDINGNKHDLDLVIEDGGTEYKIGEPRAFIEVAWRRYTKHSKNKAQEISGAVTPIADRYIHVSPFIGAILAGEFTKPSLQQLKSEGFAVLYFPFDMIVEAFKKNGLDIYYEVKTPDRETETKYAQVQRITDARRKKIILDLLRMNKTELEVFGNKLRMSLSRKASILKITMLYSDGVITFNSSDEACTYISNCPAVSNDELGLFRIEIQIEYDNGDRIQTTYSEPESAIRFIRFMSGNKS